MSSAQPVLEVDPTDALAGDGWRVRVAGASPGEDVRLMVTHVDEGDVRWESEAVFAADGYGVVDPAAAAPRSGTYEGVDPAGLFWSTRPVSGKAAGAFSKSLAPLELTVSAQIGDAEPLRQTIRRLAIAPGVEREPIARDGVLGTLFTPVQAGRRPALVVLSGSEGGGYEPSAAAYASLGYTTLALSFFGVEGLPAQLVEVPLETVERAIAWLAGHPRVDADKIGIWGVSKGAELALLAASHIPQVRAVVAKSPSAVAFEGLSDDLGKHHRSSWTYRGEPVPFVPVTFTAGIGASYGWSRLRHKPWSTTPMYAHALEDAEAVAAAAIAVEDIQGPLLLTSGGHDGAWPSGRMSEMILERRRSHGHTDDVHLHYEEAGHQIAAPYTPTTISWFVVAGGMIEDLGGTPAGNAAASADSWPRINAFLAEHLPA